MASSGVWENANLTITPTFDGVYGMLFFIIILVGIVFDKCWHVCHCICKIGGHSNKVHCTDNTYTCTEQQIHVSDSSNNTDNTKKWMIYLSTTPLTENQGRLLACEPKFTIKPRWPSVKRVHSSNREGVSKLEQGEAKRAKSRGQEGFKEITECTQNII